MKDEGKSWFFGPDQKCEIKNRRKTKRNVIEEPYNTLSKATSGQYFPEITWLRAKRLKERHIASLQLKDVIKKPYNHS
jgi:hypothetical protein